MIEIISSELCIACDLCIDICPTSVFDAVPDAAPIVARQEDCQTCFLCEAHCPVDAMYVAPLRFPAPEGSRHLDEHRLRGAGVFGSYRARLGWGKGRRPPRTAQEALALAVPFVAAECGDAA